MDRTLNDHGVGIDLVAGGKLHHIVPNESGSIHFQFLPFPDNLGFGCCQDTQFRQRLLRLQLLIDTDQGVDDNDAHECQIQPLLYRNDRQSKDKEDQVEVGKGIIQHDLFGRFAGRIHRSVHPPGHLAGTDLGCSEAKLRSGFHYFHRSSGGKLRFLYFLFKK